MGQTYKGDRNDRQNTREVIHHSTAQGKVYEDLISFKVMSTVHYEAAKIVHWDLMVFSMVT